MRTEENYQRWLNSPNVDEDTKAALRAMSEEQKMDAFFTDIEFGTAGMRGKLGPGTNRMNLKTVGKVAIGYGKYLLEKYPEARTQGVVISHDNRHFSREFTLLSAEIFNKMGIKAYIWDSLRSTPELSFAVRYAKACGGVMITASHNPKEDNGYKLYDETGCQIVPSKIKRLLDILAEMPDELNVTVPEAEVPAETVTFGPEVDDAYVEAVKACQINTDLDKSNFKIVYTPQHGASYEMAMRVFQEAGYDIIPVAEQCIHDPNFGATLSPNPEIKDSFIEPIKLAKKVGADLIVMTDPDGDRCGLAYLRDGEYHLLTGNQSGAMLIDYIIRERKAKGLLSDDPVIYDTVVTSSLGADIARSYGVKVESFLTGFKFIGERIDHYEKLGHGPHFEFGYEESYGCLIQPFARDKDGIQALLLYCEMALWNKLHGKDLGELYDDLQAKHGYHYTTLKSVYFQGPTGAATMAAIMAGLHATPLTEINGLKVVKYEDFLNSVSISGGVETKIDLPKSDVVKFTLEDKSTVAVRPSGTEPKCKFYIEAVGTSNAGLVEKAEAMVKELFAKTGINA